MDAHDYRVDPLSIEQIESRALFYRKKWLVGDAPQLNVFSLLLKKPPAYFNEIGLKLISRSAGFMGLREAYATSKPKKNILQRSHLRSIEVWR